MKQPKIRVIPHTKEDKEKAKVMEEFLNYMYPPKVIKEMVKQAMLEELAYRSNPLGACFVEWKLPTKGKEV